jgi:hypothetical protein
MLFSELFDLKYVRLKLMAPFMIFWQYTVSLHLALVNYYTKKNSASGTRIANVVSVFVKLWQPAYEGFAYCCSVQKLFPHLQRK